TGQRSKPPVRRGRHAHQRGAAPDPRQQVSNSRLSRIRVRVLPFVLGRSENMLRVLQRRARLAVAAIVFFATPRLLTAHQQPPQQDAGGYKAPTAALERGRTVYVLNHCHFCHGADLTQATMGAANLVESALVGFDQDGTAIGPLVRAGLPNLQTAMPSYRD